MGNAECTLALHESDRDGHAVCFLDPVFFSSDVAASNVPTCHLTLPDDGNFGCWMANYVFAISENSSLTTKVLLDGHGLAAVNVGPEGLRVSFDHGLVLSSPWAGVPENGPRLRMAIGVYYYARGMCVRIEEK